MAFRRIFLSLSIIFLIASFDAYGQFFKSKKIEPFQRLLMALNRPMKGMQFPLSMKDHSTSTKKSLRKLNRWKRKKTGKNYTMPWGDILKILGSRIFIKILTCYGGMLN